MKKKKNITNKLDNNEELSAEEEEDLYIIISEENHINELMTAGMKKNFQALSELLVSCFFSETISDMIEYTSDINEYLSLNLTEENEDPDDIFFDGVDTQIAEKLDKNIEEDGSFSEKPTGINLENSIKKLQTENISKNIFSKFGINIMGGGDIRGNLKGTTIAKEITEIGSMITEWEEKQEDTLLTLSVLTNESEEVSSSSEQVSSSSEQKQTSSSSTQSIINELNNVGLFNFTKKILLENIISHPINQKDPKHPYLFNTTTDDWILFEIAENSQKTMTDIFYNLYQNEILKNDDFTPEEDYDFFNKDEKYIILINMYFNQLKKKNNKYTDEKDEKDDKYRALHDSVMKALQNQNPNEIKTSLNSLFRFVVLYSHPDKFEEADRIFATAQFSMILDAFKSIKNIYGLKGGGKKKTKKQKKQEMDAFIGLNKLLGKTIIENSLSLMKCISGIKSHGYFPIINTKTLGNSTKGTYKKFFSGYSGRKPKFLSIFNGQGMKQTFTVQRYYDTSKRGGIDWEKICPSDYNEFMTKPVGGAPLELRKLIARRILLNIQVLILYLRCSPGTVKPVGVLNALYLTIDKTGRDLNYVKKTNYWSRGKTPNDRKKINNHFGITPSASSDETPEEIITFIETNRTKWFGFMFDFYEDKPDEYAKINKKTGVKVPFIPHVTLPEWLTSGTEDDALQYSFNIVLQKLLPEFVFFMGDNEIMKLPGFTKKDIGTIALDHPLPKPFTDGETASSNRNAYVINNAAKIYPTQQKMNQPRNKFFNLSGENIREAQFCPIASIADNQSLCSVTAPGMAAKTFARSHTYDLEMGLEAEDAVGQTYSYLVNMTKSGTIDTYYISAVLSIPGIPSIMVGDMGEKNDLKGSPLGAVSTYYHLLKNMNKNISQFIMTTTSTSKGSSPREILSDFFKKNMETITKMCVKKSIGDYGQEHTASAKFGAGVPQEVKSAVTDSAGNNIVLPYTVDGDSLRIMLARDRPSAYRNIFMLLFSEENSVNSRAAAGYWDESAGVMSHKNTIVISPATLLPKDATSDKINFNRSPDPDSALGFPDLNAVPGVVKGTIVSGTTFRQENLRENLRKSKRIQKRVAFNLSQRVKIKRGFAKWLKNNEIRLSELLTTTDDDIFTKKKKIIDLKNLFLKEMGVTKGGKRKTKKRRSKKSKKRTKRRSTKKKRKTIKKRKKKRRYKTKKK